MLLSEFRQLDNGRNKRTPKKQQIAPKNAVITIKKTLLPERTRTAGIATRLKIPRSIRNLAQPDSGWVSTVLVEGGCVGTGIIKI